MRTIKAINEDLNQVAVERQELERRRQELKAKIVKLAKGADVENNSLTLWDVEHELEDKLEPTDEVFKGIGTRNSESATGEFIVYFDDVYVRYSD